jgi:hypothetical protein
MDIDGWDAMASKMEAYELSTSSALHASVVVSKVNPGAPLLVLIVMFGIKSKNAAAGSSRRLGLPTSLVTKTLLIVDQVVSRALRIEYYVLLIAI